MGGMEEIVLDSPRKFMLGLVAAIALLLTNSAFAASYNIIFKTTDNAIICGAHGGFTFTKDTEGSSAPSGASALLQQVGCPTQFVPAIANGTYSPGTLNVVVQNITTPQPQGLNVEGLTGTLVFTTTTPGACDGTGTSTDPKTYTITFNYDNSPVPAPTSRTFTLTCSGPGNFSTTGHYDVRNTASVPEPETLLLMLAGLGGYKLVMRRRRKLQA
jgi:hypothetical protein